MMRRKYGRVRLNGLDAVTWLMGERWGWWASLYIDACTPVCSRRKRYACVIYAIYGSPCLSRVLSLPVPSRPFLLLFAPTDQDTDAYTDKDTATGTGIETDTDTIPLSSRLLITSSGDDKNIGGRLRVTDPAFMFSPFEAEQMMYLSSGSGFMIFWLMDKVSTEP